LALWDLSRATILDLGEGQLRRLACEIQKTSSGKRPGGKTALVVARPVDYGIGRMLEAYTEFEHLDFQLRVFNSVHAAREWLGVAG
jgi:hypothetical protein